MAEDALKKVDAYLAESKTFYLATVEDGKPRCRPIGFHQVRDGNLYFGVGEFKAVYRQMVACPQVEICASDGRGFLRYYGTAVFENDYRIAEDTLAASPGMRQIYNEETGNKLGVFHLESATAEFHDMLNLLETLSFE